MDDFFSGGGFNALGGPSITPNYNSGGWGSGQGYALGWLPAGSPFQNNSLNTSVNSLYGAPSNFGMPPLNPEAYYAQRGIRNYEWPGGPANSRQHELQLPGQAALEPQDNWPQQATAAANSPSAGSYGPLASLPQPQYLQPGRPLTGGIQVGQPLTGNTTDDWENDPDIIGYGTERNNATTGRDEDFIEKFNIPNYVLKNGSYVQQYSQGTTQVGTPSSLTRSYPGMQDDFDNFKNAVKGLGPNYGLYGYEEGTGPVSDPTLSAPIGRGQESRSQISPKAINKLPPDLQKLMQQRSPNPQAPFSGNPLLKGDALGTRSYTFGQLQAPQMQITGSARARVRDEWADDSSLNAYGEQVGRQPRYVQQRGYSQPAYQPGRQTEYGYDPMPQGQLQQARQLIDAMDRSDKLRGLTPTERAEVRANADARRQQQKRIERQNPTNDPSQAFFRDVYSPSGEVQRWYFPSGQRRQTPLNDNQLDQLKSMNLNARDQLLAATGLQMLLRRMATGRMA